MTDSSANRRRFVRHTTDVPLEVERLGESSPLIEVGTDISHGGLAFLSTTCPQVGEILQLRISTVKPVFEARAQVAWCRPEGGKYLVGVRFLDASDAFRARMVEQVCAIEQYRAEVREREGRDLTTADAAAEWIGMYAERFPGADV
jgi:c-di-GMP-binding flagellar brake protein YcgR